MPCRLTVLIPLLEATVGRSLMARDTAAFVAVAGSAATTVVKNLDLSPVPVANLIRLAVDRESGNPVVG